MSLETTIIERLKRIDLRLERLASAVEAGAIARKEDDDAWTRLPRPKGRCPVSGWSRSTVAKKIKEGCVRSKSIGGARYYSGKDMLNLLNLANA